MPARSKPSKINVKMPKEKSRKPKVETRKLRIKVQKKSKGKQMRSLFKKTKSISGIQGDIKTRQSIHFADNELNLEYEELLLELEEEKEDSNDESIEVESSIEEQASTDSEIDEHLHLVEQRAKQLKRKKETDFFQKLGKFPNIDDISLSESVSTSIVTDSADIVEPEDMEEETRVSADDGAYVEEDSSSIFSAYDFDIETSEVEDQEETKPISIDVLLDLVTKNTAKVVFEEPDFDFFVLLEAKKQLEKDSLDFLRALVNAVVEASEYVDPREVLREKLDKVTLFKELMRLLDSLKSERKIAEFLGNKCVIYFRRLKNFRAIQPETEEEFLKHSENYNEVLSRLHCLLDSEKLYEVNISQKIQENEELAKKLEKQLAVTSSKLKFVMSKVLRGEPSNDIKMFVQQKFKEITNLSREISTVREILIKRQHTDVALLHKMENLENVTETLRLHDYEKLLIDEYSLSKKLEEKTERLVNLQRKFNTDSSVVAHIREKQSMDLHALRHQMENLDAIETEKRKLQSYIHKLRVAGIRMKKDIYEKNMEHGLICQPTLLLDFDKTVEHGQEMKEKLENLKHEIQKLENKISFLEKRAACI